MIVWENELAEVCVVELGDRFSYVRLRTKDGYTLKCIYSFTKWSKTYKQSGELFFKDWRKKNRGKLVNLRREKALIDSKIKLLESV